MKPLGLLRMGNIYIAFILFDLTMLSWGFVDKNIYDNIGIISIKDKVCLHSSHLDLENTKGSPLGSLNPTNV